MKTLLKNECFDFISYRDKKFIVAFDDEMKKLGYDFGNKIGSGYCWGKYMIIYTKSGVKSKKVAARIYIRDDNIVLRLFFSGIDKHRKYIENSPSHIKEVFTRDYGNCNHCHNEKDGDCQFRKSYIIDDRLIDKCNGRTFEFHKPAMENMPDYIALFLGFYPIARVKRIRLTKTL